MRRVALRWLELVAALPATYGASGVGRRSRRARKQGIVFSDYRRGQLHGRSRDFINRPAADPHGHDDGRPGGRETGLPARPSRIARREGAGYARAVRQEHLGDRHEFLPTVHGSTVLRLTLTTSYAMEDPAHPNYRRTC